MSSKYRAGPSLNLAPLKLSIFTECKSNIKFLEAAAVATPTLATKSSPYLEIIENLENGYIGSPKDWYELLNESYENHSARIPIAFKAQELAKNEYSIHGTNRSLDHYVEILGEMCR